MGSNPISCTKIEIVINKHISLIFTKNIIFIVDINKEFFMEKVKNLIIGFGKVGKTLANIFAKKGESTILIERSNLMYGGTCINVACIPSKTLENLARESAHVVEV